MDDEPVFREPWEAQAFALAVALHQQGLFTWPEWAATLADEIKRAQATGDPDTGETYYRHWLAALERLVAEKGAQLGFVAQGMLLVVSGVYYPVEIMPGWMQAISTISPATYALHGIRAAVLDGAGAGAVWGDVWPLIVLGVVAIPAGLAVFRAGERYAKRHGKLKRSG